MIHWLWDIEDRRHWGQRRWEHGIEDMRLWGHDFEDMLWGLDFEDMRLWGQTLWNVCPQKKVFPQSCLSSKPCPQSRLSSMSHSRYMSMFQLIVIPISMRISQKCSTGMWRYVRHNFLPMGPRPQPQILPENIEQWGKEEIYLKKAKPF